MTDILTRRRVVLSVAVVVLALVATVSFRSWKWHQLPKRVEAALPERPDVGAFPAALETRIQKAAAKAGVRETALEGVADLGRLYHANGFYHQAAACWELLRRERPDDARWAYYLADVDSATGDMARALFMLRQTTELAPDYAPAWLRLADQLLKTGEPNAAAKYYRDRLALVPDDPYAQLGLSRVALQRNDSEDARRRLMVLVEAHPGFPPAHNLLAEIFANEGEEARAKRQRDLGRKSGRFLEASDPWLEALYAHCFDPARLQVLATKKQASGDTARGIALLQRAVELAPDDLDGYAELGEVYLKMGDGKLARETLESGLAREGASRPTSMYFVHLSHAHRMLGDPEKAVEVAQKAISELGGSLELYDALGVALGELGRNEDAANALRKALELDPNDATANVNLATALLALGRTEEARVHLEHAQTQRPTLGKIRSMLGRLELKAGNLEAAENQLRPLYESSPGVPEAQQLMVTWLLRAGKDAAGRRELSTAEAHFREGLAIDPDSVELNANLGVQLLVEGRVQDALVVLETYHRLEPENPQSALFLGQAYARLGWFAEARPVLETGVRLAEKAGIDSTASYCREILEQLP